MSQLEVFAQYFKYIGKLANKMCNCENSDCSHDPARCHQPATGKRIMYLGDVCNDCYENMPEEYRLPEKLDYSQMINKIPDHPKNRRDYNPKHPENPHHMKHRVDIDPDQLSFEDLHPDEMGNMFDEQYDPDFAQEDWSRYDIATNPKDRQKRIEERKRLGPFYNPEDD